VIQSHEKANLLGVRLCVGSLYHTVESTYWILLAVVVALGVARARSKESLLLRAAVAHSRKVRIQVPL
jgi:hypothetical protein